MLYKLLLSLLISHSLTFGSEKASLVDILSANQEHEASIQKAVEFIASPHAEDKISFESLLGGLSKSSLFVIFYNDQKHVMRILDRRKELERRTSEVILHQKAAQMNLAPKLLFVDNPKDPFVLVMSFIEGRTFSKNDLKDIKLLDKVISSLKKIHEISEAIPIKSSTKMDTLEFYISRYHEKGFIFPPFYNELLKTLKEDYSRISRKRMPSHGDFNSANIMITKDGNVNFIDFAECGYDHPFLDLGWFLFILGQTEKEMAKTLLALYMEREPSKMEVDDVLFFEELSAFFLGTIWLTRQENNDIKKLEELFKTDLKKASDYVKEGLKRTEIAKMSKEELTNYALGFFKDFMAIRQMRKVE